MAEFPIFGKLPIELRFDIWEKAAVEECRGRLVVMLWNEYVIPLKSLISPLLMVNSESRMCALKVCSTRLQVFKVPEPEADTEVLEYFKEWQEQSLPNARSEGSNVVHPYTIALPETSFRELEFELFFESTSHNIRNIEELGSMSGVVYVSTAHDKFLLQSQPEREWPSKVDYMRPFWAEKSFVELGRRIAPAYPWHFVTARLDKQTIEMIRKPVACEQYTGRSHSADEEEMDRRRGSPIHTDFYGYLCYNNDDLFYYRLGKAHRLWCLDRFKGAATFYHMWYDGLEDFIPKVMTTPASMLAIQEWEYRRHWVENDSNVGPVLVDLEAYGDLQSDFHRQMQIEAENWDEWEPWEGKPIAAVGFRIN